MSQTVSDTSSKATMQRIFVAIQCKYDAKAFNTGVQAKQSLQRSSVRSIKIVMLLHKPL